MYMTENEQLLQLIDNLREDKSGTALISINEDGSFNVTKEEKTDYGFIVFENDGNFEPLLTKLVEQGYSLDIKTFHGLIPARDLIRVDATHKAVKRPLIVGLNHYRYLKTKESILLIDVLNAFDELIVKKNKELANSLAQYQKNK